MTMEEAFRRLGRALNEFRDAVADASGLDRLLAFVTRQVMKASALHNLYLGRHEVFQDCPVCKARTIPGLAATRSVQVCLVCDSMFTVEKQGVLEYHPTPANVTFRPHGWIPPEK